MSSLPSTSVPRISRHPASLRRRIAVATVVTLLGACSQLPVAGCRELSAPAAAEDPAGDVVIDPALEYEDLMGFLDGEARRVSQARQARWQPDYDSVERYLASVRDHRQRFREIRGVPAACLGAEPPRLLRDEPVRTVGSVQIRSWEIDVCGGRLTSRVLVAIPLHAAGPLPAVIALHGTCGSPERVLGLQGDDYHHGFGQRLARLGFVVVAPSVLTRPTTTAAECVDPRNQRRNRVDRRAAPLGMHLVGLEIGKLMGVIDLLGARGDMVDAARIGAYGISLGGLLAFSLAASDTRVRATVVSAFVEDRVGKLVGADYPDALWRYEDADYLFVDGYLEYFTDVEVAGLVAPRKLFIETGSEDERALAAEAVVRRVETIFERLDQPPGSIEIGIGRGGHEVFFDRAADFLEHWLTGES